jgi:hypothetical protein
VFFEVWGVGCGVVVVDFVGWAARLGRRRAGVFACVRVGWDGCEGTWTVRACVRACWRACGGVSE